METSTPESELFKGSFEDFALSEALNLGLKDLGYLHPTAVQTAVFPKAKEGLDLIVQSRTGSGKTTAFCLPVLAQLDPQANFVQALILVPTRELAKQVATESARLGHAAGLKIATIYGGASMNAQAEALKGGAKVVVGTPGRVRDLIERKILVLDQAKHAVLDEADEMLSMGFWEDVQFILSKLPKDRQTLLFSATLPPQIESQLPSIMKTPERLNLSSDAQTAKTVRHVVHVEDESQPKPRSLLSALEFHRATSAIVFCNMKEETEVVERYLQRFGYNARALNGDMPQGARERVMSDMREGKIDLIIATDVAARGIDISGITHVFNYELPENDEVYVHRTGRTGRIGKMGVAASLVRGKDVIQLEHLCEKFGVQFEDVQLPPEAEINWMQGERLAILLTEEADGVEISQYRAVAQTMIERADAREILAFLLRSHFTKPTKKSEQHEQRPMREPKFDRRKDKDKRRYKEKEPQEPAPALPVQAAPAFAEAEISEAEEFEPESGEQEEGLSEDMAADDNIHVERTDRPARLYMTMGRDDGFHEMMDLAKFVAQEAQVDFGHFTGMGQLRDSSSHLEVDEEAAQAVIDTFNNRARNLEQTKGANAQNPTILCEIAKGEQPRHKHKRHRPR